MARTITRRAERYIVTLQKEEDVSPLLLTYMNRLSDALFATALNLVYKQMVKTVKAHVQGELGLVPNLCDLCEPMLQAAFDASQKLNVTVSVAIVDNNGNLLSFKRDQNAILASIELSINKAYTAIAMNMDTQKLALLASPTGPLFGINVTNPRLVIFGGGLPLIKNNMTIGAIGVSGASVENDITIAKQAAQLLKEV